MWPGERDHWPGRKGDTGDLPRQVGGKEHLLVRGSGRGPAERAEGGGAGSQQPDAVRAPSTGRGTWLPAVPLVSHLAFGLEEQGGARRDGRQGGRGNDEAVLGEAKGPGSIAGEPWGTPSGGDHLAVCTYIEPLWCTPKANRMFYANFISMEKKRKSELCRPPSSAEPAPGRGLQGKVSFQIGV